MTDICQFNAAFKIFWEVLNLSYERAETDAREHQ